jgi:parallel beta-helix repeat protein
LRDRRSPKILLAVLLLSTVLGSTLAFSPPPVFASVGCGSVITKNTTLSANIGPCLGDGLVIGANHITLNCNRHEISGPPGGESNGIDLNATRGVTVKNCDVIGFYTGYNLNGSSGDRLIGNIANGPLNTGFYAAKSTADVLTKNLAVSSDAAGTESAFVVQNSAHDLLISNTAAVSPSGSWETGFFVYDSRSITLTKDRSGSSSLMSGNGVGFGILDSSQNHLSSDVSQFDSDGFSVQDSSSNTFSHNIASNALDDGFIISNSTSSTFSGNVLNDDTSFGLQAFDSSRNLFTGNMIDDSLSGGAFGGGLALVDSESNVLKFNLARDTGWATAGFYLGGSTRNTLYNNKATSDYVGFFLDILSNNNVLRGNAARDNSWDGFDFYGASHNSIIANIAKNNTGDGFFFAGGLSSCSSPIYYTHSSLSHAGCGYADGNTLSRNTAIGNKYDGFDFWTARSNNLKTNTAEKNARNGFELSFSSDRNSLQGDTAQANGLAGFAINGSSDHNDLAGDTARSNGDHGYYLYNSTSNLLRKDLASHNGFSGFMLNGSSGNTIQLGKADWNSAFGYLDNSTDSRTGGTANYYLADDCRGNTWGGSSPSGICTPQR